MFRRAWWQSRSILEGRQGARKKKKWKKIYFFVINEVAIHIFWHLMFDLLFFSVSHCDLTKKTALVHARSFSQITKNSGKLQWPDSNVVIWQKKIACSISHVKWQFVFCEIAMGTRKKFKVAMMFELRFFASDCDLTKIKSRKLQWADDGNEF